MAGRASLEMCSYPCKRVTAHRTVGKDRAQRQECCVHFVTHLTKRMKEHTSFWNQGCSYPGQPSRPLTREQQERMVLK